MPLRGCAHQRAAHVTELAAIGAGVHDGGSADGAGNTAGELVARQSSSERSLGNCSALEAPASTVMREPSTAIPENRSANRTMTSGTPVSATSKSLPRPNKRTGWPAS